MSALEYDDIVDGEVTKFKYASVPKEDYGLSTEEILAADDQLLNSFVSLKKVTVPINGCCNDDISFVCPRAHYRLTLDVFLVFLISSSHTRTHVFTLLLCVSNADFRDHRWPPLTAKAS